MRQLKLTAEQIVRIATRRHARFWRDVSRTPPPPFLSLSRSEQRHWCKSVREYLEEAVSAGFDIVVQRVEPQRQPSPRRNRARAPPRRK